MHTPFIYYIDYSRKTKAGTQLTEATREQSSCRALPNPVQVW